MTTNPGTDSISTAAMRRKALEEYVIQRLPVKPHIRFLSIWRLGRGSARSDGWRSSGSARGAELAAAASAAVCCRSESGARSGDWRRWVVVLSCADEIDLHPRRDSPSPSQRFENPLDGAG